MLLDLDAIFDPDQRATPIGGPGLLPSDWHDNWNERAAIMEYEGGLPHLLAERLALLEIRKLLVAGQSLGGPVRHPVAIVAR
jgi:hypothetical protein